MQTENEWEKEWIVFGCRKPKIGNFVGFVIGYGVCKEHKRNI